MRPSVSIDQEVILSILSSKRCIEIIQLISQTEYTASSLSKHLDTSMSTVSYYLKRLTEANIIDVNYNIDDMRIRELSLSARGKTLLFMYENETLFHPMVIGDFRFSQDQGRH